MACGSAAAKCAALPAKLSSSGRSVSGNRTIALALATGSPERDGASITAGIPRNCSSANRTTSIASRKIAEELTGISLTPDKEKKKPSELEADWKNFK